MDRIDLLRIFARVVECASFTKASATLQMPRSSVSMAVQELEGRVGARLLNRTTRRVAPTLDGAAFYERCLRLLADYEETEGLFRQSKTRPRGKLRMNVPARMGRLVFAPALPDFLAAYPEIEIELGATDRAVDLVQEGIDCVVRVGPLEDSSLIARKVGDVAICNCASAGYLNAHGTPRAIDDLANHFAVGYASPSTGKVEAWEFVDNGSVRQLAMRSKVTVNNAEAYIACCLAGLGLIQNPVYDLRDHLARGELVEVLPKARAAPMPLHVLYPHRQHLSRRLQVLLEWTTELLRSRVLTADPLMP